MDEDGRKKAEASLMEAIGEAEELGAKGIAFRQRMRNTNSC